MEQKPIKKQPTDEEKEKLFQNILKNAMQSGYFLNPDKEYTLFLMNGLLVNENRYGYRSCPCRLSSGISNQDQDLVCPCDYRDPDLAEYGMCYCALYVSKDVADGKKQIESIPERRNFIAKASVDSMNKKNAGVVDSEPEQSLFANIKYPIWRCKVCGYLCSRENPPELCPICKVGKERFERIL